LTGRLGRHGHYFAGLSHAEIAAVLELTERSIESHRAAARESLRDVL
jgi:DNA-directed RNA polymerase specialized sigma24 family protein